MSLTSTRYKRTTIRQTPLFAFVSFSRSKVDSNWIIVIIDKCRLWNLVDESWCCGICYPSNGREKNERCCQLEHRWWWRKGLRRAYKYANTYVHDYLSKIKLSCQIHQLATEYDGAERRAEWLTKVRLALFGLFGNIMSQDLKIFFLDLSRLNWLTFTSPQEIKKCLHRSMLSHNYKSVDRAAYASLECESEIHHQVQAQEWPIIDSETVDINIKFNYESY